MKRHHAGIAVLAVLAGVPAAVVAATSVDKVTGGGQIIAADATGAGKTIAFTAQNLAPGKDPAKGQVQYNDHLGVKVHGVVDCLHVVRGTEEDDPDTAVIGGKYRKNSTQRFRIYVVDNGQGAAADGDLVAFEDADEAADAQADRGPCEAAAESFNDLPQLGRGNVKIHKTSG